MDADRREILKQAAALLAGLTLARCKSDPPATPDAAPPAADAAAAAELADQEPARAFHPLQRKTIEAACARILPTDHDPGATEANVVEYIDRELARAEFDSLKKTVIGGAVALDKYASRLGGKAFVDLDGAEQDDILVQLQNATARGQDFVKFLVLLTLEGFASDPAYGGNQNGVGWSFIGYGPGASHGHH